MNFMGLFSKLSTFVIPSQIRHISTNVSPLFFQVTNTLLGEPLKKKRRIDPAIVRQREERKKKKIEKRIRRLEKISKQLKPIDEVEIPLKLIDQKDTRLRKLPALSAEELNRRVLLQKKWSRYRLEQHKNDTQILDNIIFSQQRALDELKAVSVELYNEAIQVDVSFLPFETKGPVFTPSIENFNAPDGDYMDITKKFEGE